MKSAKLKCKLTKRSLSLCSVLERSLSDGKEITTKFIMNLKGKLIRTIVVAKSGEFRKTGIVLNYCPFCGTQIFNSEPGT